MTQLAEKADLDALAKWAQKQGLKTVPVGAFEDADGPPSYKLHKDADVTVLLFAKQKVIANFAFRAGELTDKQHRRGREGRAAAVREEVTTRCQRSVLHRASSFSSRLLKPQPSRSSEPLICRLGVKSQSSS